MRINSFVVNVCLHNTVYKMIRAAASKRVGKLTIADLLIKSISFDEPEDTVVNIENEGNCIFFLTVFSR